MNTIGFARKVDFLDGTNGCFRQEDFDMKNMIKKLLHRERCANTVPRDWRTDSWDEYCVLRNAWSCWR